MERAQRPAGKHTKTGKERYGHTSVCVPRHPRGGAAVSKNQLTFRASEQESAYTSETQFQCILRMCEQPGALGGHRVPKTIMASNARLLAGPTQLADWHLLLLA
ncbi:hypothetical protein I79_024640 [Cricetulus griseus]|uniref:Uncharacterized protein n=1 Tax=Cricetulus griseus TaxID=10029 RepID=G3IL78_CRIGR|nr:hypothetical protein I79_024640 [Cricetulus griseus]